MPPAGDAPDVGGFDGAAPDAVGQAFGALRLADAREGPLPLSTRREILGALAEALVARREEIADAIDADFGRRSRDETLIAEVFLAAEAARHARRRVARWARPRRIATGAPFWPTQARVLHQPLGVVGIIAPWNYPVQLAVVPVVSAIAAGNRVLVKPSEMTPRTASLLAELLEGACGSSIVRTVLGDASVAEAVTRLPLDHLLFTGSTQTGRRVLAAAAENLVPVTLELGGKCHAIVTADVDLDPAARSIVMGKGLNAGQTCLAPDTVLLVGVEAGAFKAAIGAAFDLAYPDGLPTRLLSARHRERQAALREDGEITELGAAPSSERLAVIEPRAGTRAATEEIFGPLLALVPVADLDAAIAHLRRLPAPLAIYLYTRNRETERRVLDATRSGALVVNGTVTFAAMHDLPFGGVGASGMGRYHGEAGFAAFSNPRAHVRGARWSLSSLLDPPYTSRTRALVSRLLRIRPESRRGGGR